MSAVELSVRLLAEPESPSWRVDALGRVMRPLARPPGKLTKRHLDVITLVSHGRTNAEIADQLGICDRIVKLEITHACQVLHAHNRAHLAATAIRKGLVT